MTEIEVREGIDTDEDEDLAAWEVRAPLPTHTPSGRCACRP